MGPWGTAAAAWAKEPPSHPKVAKDMRPVESESTYWHQGHKNPLECVIFKAYSCCVTGSAQQQFMKLFLLHGGEAASSTAPSDP